MKKIINTLTLPALAVSFLALLKLAGLTPLSWLMVFLPAWLPVVFVLIILIIGKIFTK